MNQIGPFFFPVDSRTVRQLLMELEGAVVREAEQSQLALIKAYTPFHVDGKGNGINLFNFLGNQTFGWLARYSKPRLIPGDLKMQMEKVFMEKMLEADPEFQKAIEKFGKEQQQKPGVK